MSSKNGSKNSTIPTPMRLPESWTCWSRWAPHFRFPTAVPSIALRELRIQSGGKPLRVLYAFDPSRQAVLLIGGDKTGDKTGDKRFYETMVPLSEKIWFQYLKETGQ